MQQVKLGDPIQDPDAAPQVNIAVGVWVAAELEDKITGYCLVSVIQAPGGKKTEKIPLFRHTVKTIFSFFSRKRFRSI